MAQTQPSKTLFPKMNGMYLSALLAVALAAGTGGYKYWNEQQKFEAKMPRNRLDAIVKNLRQYYTRQGRFPGDLVELNELIWKKSFVFEDRNHSVKMANYYYFFNRVQPDVSTVWACPIGERRDEAAAFFMVVTPTKLRTWKGPALSLSEIQSVARLSDPKPAELALLGLNEQRLETTPAKKSIFW